LLKYKKDRLTSCRALLLKAIKEDDINKQQKNMSRLQGKWSIKEKRKEKIQKGVEGFQN
jgi:hypothetical protein